MSMMIVCQGLTRLFVIGCSKDVDLSLSHENRCIDVLLFQSPMYMADIWAARFSHRRNIYHAYTRNIELVKI